MSRSIFIQNTSGIEGSNPSTLNPDSITAGKVALLGVDGEGLIGLNSGGPLPKRFQVVRSISGENARRSSIINASDIKGVTFKAYSAPVAQVTTITPVAGSTSSGLAGVKITRIDGGFERYPRANYEIEVASSDDASAIVTKLKDAIDAAKKVSSPINSNNVHVVTASGSTTLVLTAISPAINKEGTPVHEWVSFSTGLYGEATSGWTVASTTAPSRGSGSYAQVYEYESKSFGNTGFYYTEHYPQRPQNHATPGVNYDLVTLQVCTNADMAINKSFLYQEVVIAAPNGELNEELVLQLFGVSEASPSA